MTILLSSVDVRHERRLRLTFTNTLAVGAFSTSLYRVESTDGAASDPPVVAAMLVPGMGNNVELALGVDLVSQCRYRVYAEAVPAIDLSVTATGTNEPFVFGMKLGKLRVEPLVRDRERLVLMEDIIWNGTDFQESPTGDMATVAGKANVTKGLLRSIETSGLPWDPTWGVDGREWVDSPSAAAGTLKGAISRQILRDPRVGRVSSTVSVNLDETVLVFTPILKSGDALEPVSQTVPSS